MPKPDGTPMHSLILAGGGVKVAFQAGVLEVWLDEVGEFGRPILLRELAAEVGLLYLTCDFQPATGRLRYRKSDLHLHTSSALQAALETRGDATKTRLRRYRLGVQVRQVLETWLHRVEPRPGLHSGVLDFLRLEEVPCSS